jgi:hypothetical protein
MSASADFDNGSEGSYTLSSPAADIYATEKGKRRSAEDQAERMARLTIPSVFPPEYYQTGDKLPGNNQSAGAQCLNNLSSKVMFLAFPPGQPILRYEAIAHKIQREIAQDPDLYASMQQGLSQLEVAHRKRFQATPIQSAYTGYVKNLFVAGNCLWKHTNLNSPTFHTMRHYIVVRDNGGHPILTIHEECVKVMTLDEDVQEVIYNTTPDVKKQKEWDREVKIYSVCKLETGHNSGDMSWVYWQEYEGKYLPDSGVETDYDDCPMWPGWLIPVYGQNWGRGYCEEYQGDLYALESLASALNDGTSLAAWALTFVKPGGRTSIKAVREASNLDMLPGDAADVTVLRSDKTTDLTFALNWFGQVVRRVAAAFLLQASVRREGERVTAEEIQRLAGELDQAMGGLYTEIAQSSQRRILMRAVRLHEEEDEDLPHVDEEIVSVQVVTGTDALGRSAESTSLINFAKVIAELFPQQAAVILDGLNFATRLAAAEGIKPDGLVKTKGQIAGEQQQAQQQQMGQTLVSQAAPLAKIAAEQMNPQQPPQEGA